MKAEELKKKLKKMRHEYSVAKEIDKLFESKIYNPRRTNSNAGISASRFSTENHYGMSRTKTNTTVQTQGFLPVGFQRKIHCGMSRTNTNATIPTQGFLPVGFQQKDITA